MVILSKFAENLSALMSERNLNAPALAKIIKTDRSNITRYQKGERLPLFDGFVGIIEYFNVSADLLLGRVEFTAETDFLPVCNFGERLRAVMAETKTSQYEIEKNTDISSSSMYKWLFGQGLPNTESLVKLAEYMDISVDYLLGRIK